MNTGLLNPNSLVVEDEEEFVEMSLLEAVEQMTNNVSKPKLVAPYTVPGPRINLVKLLEDIEED